MESLHKLTAGDGYDYLTRQVAVADATDLGRSSLGDYYAEKGETPGVWLGSGLAALDTGKHAVTVGDTVTQEQMKALFGEGLHPNADAILAEAIALGRSEQVALSLTRLGRPFKVYSGASAFRVEVARRFQAYNSEIGAKWNAPIDPEVRAAIRTQVSREFFEKEYGRSPLHDTELSGWMARLSRQQTDAVAGFDATFSPVKSVSALWALAPRPVAETIAAAHHAAVADALNYLESHACYTRLGTDGIAQVDGDGFLAAAFTHRDSRAGDPDLHTHLVISNKVRTTGPDAISRWLALDARPLYKVTVSASEIYNSRLEAHLTGTLPVRFAPREGGDPRKRPVREIVGIDPALLDAWSTRRAAIDSRTGELAREFQCGHGREPTPVEAVALAQQANLETRQRKHEPRSLGEQRATWYQEATHVLGGPGAVTAMLADTLTRPAATAPTITPEWIAEHADAIVATTSAARARWQSNHLRAEAERVVRAAGIPLADMDTVAARLVDAACHPARAVELRAPAEASTALTPDVLRRRDGSSVYTVAGTQLFTSEAVLAAETRLLWAAHRPGGHVAAARDVELALLEAAANGRELNTGQATLVRELATSGRRLQLALAPAGTGKTTAMKTLARAWTNTPGRRVLGLAPTAAAAAVLRQEIDTTTDNLAKLNHLIYTAAGLDPTAMPTPIADRALELGHGLPLAHRLPTWFTRIGAATLVVVDEAGMAGTRELDLAVSYLLDCGADVRLIADDRQLAAVAAGGILRDIADTAGAVTLSHVVRFTDTAEGSASLALRAGDPAALGFYLDHGRIHVGSAATVTDDGYTAWARDRASGRDTIMLAYTRDTVDHLNARARTDRLATTPTTPNRKGPGRWLHRRADADHTREVALADGLYASAGDIVCTRRNDRTIPITTTDWVRNGDRWHVDTVRADGSIQVRHLDLHRSVTLPADYVRDHTTLGYARTIHGAQGLTADTCHTILTGTETRELLYVAATRGRHTNHLYLTTASDGDLHTVMTEKGLLPSTAVDTLTDMLRHEGAEPSAHTTMRELADPATRLHHAASSYDDAVGAAAAETLLGTTAMSGLDADADLIVHGVTGEPAWPVLRRHLATLALDGHDPLEQLADAAARTELGTARDKAAVLDWRIDHTGMHSHDPGPLPWLPALPAALTEHPDWAPYLTARADEVLDYARQLADTATAWTPTSAPVWARPYAGTDTALTTELAVFRAAHGVDDQDRRPTGPDQYPVASRRVQTTLDDAANTVAADPAAAAARWRPLADSLDPHIVRDPYWLELADKLDRLARAGLDVTALTHTAVTEWPLPDTLPAAALWWRLARTVEPGALEATHSTVVLRPSWADGLTDVVGLPRAHRVMADPAWPALVAAVESARHTPWTPHSVIGTAHELLTAGHGDAPVPPDELAAALAVRVELLVRLETARRYVPIPDEPPLTPEEEESLIPLDPQADPTDETSSARGRGASDDLAGHGCIASPSEEIPLPDPPQDEESFPPPDEDDARPRPLTTVSSADAVRVHATRRAAQVAQDELERFARSLDDDATAAAADVADQLTSMQAHYDREARPRHQAIDANQRWIEIERAAEALARRVEDLTAQRDAASPNDATGIDAELNAASAQAQRLLGLAQSARAAAEVANDALRTATHDIGIETDDGATVRERALRSDEDSLMRLRTAVSAAEHAHAATETDASRTQAERERGNQAAPGTTLRTAPTEAFNAHRPRQQSAPPRPDRHPGRRM